ncbi:medium-chain acyl-CoA ligase ACSF2, mitochondrial-like [Sabethes cyaneus]|uniref:medium-chain acyl-CoA ligase ACSF2, mitochondrial-like n=1 Tax=Sabethes cyaneus TaxID=53552 RepID=UPI00237DF691|nr:medium-chain acyl-CoA ligase ACSF2, mitochondrial-like [Sabethes cyaneus]
MLNIGAVVVYLEDNNMIRRKWYYQSKCTLASVTSSAKLLESNDQSYVHHVGDTPLIYRNIGQHLRVAAQQFANNEAMISCHDAKRLTYAEVLDKVDRLAASFYQLGLKRNDRIAIWTPNSATYYLTTLAAARAGMISVGINPAFQLPELQYALNKVGAKALVATEGFRSRNYYTMLKQLIPELEGSSKANLKSAEVPSLRSVIMDTVGHSLEGTITLQDLYLLAADEETSQIETLQSSIAPDSGACLLLTSGTTGKPKAALLSHYALVNNGVHAAYRTKLDSEPRRLCVQVPLFHVFGKVFGTMAALQSGSTMVFPGEGFNVRESLEAVAKHKCSLIYGTPTMYVDLLKEYVKSNIKQPTIDIAMIGAAACSPQLVDDIQSVLGVKQVLVGYGMTELSGASFMSDRGDPSEVVYDTVGRLMDHCEAKVVDGEGNTVPFGTPGELWIRGYGTMLGYWDDDLKTKEIITGNRWLRTGDQFVLRPDGYGAVVGRMKEVIIRGGENVFPKEIEDILNAHPKIIEAHCIGVPDERMGEEICAYVRLKEPAEENFIHLDDINHFCREKIAHYKVPKILRIVEQFPKTTSGKIQKFKLLEMYLNKDRK